MAEQREIPPAATDNPDRIKRRPYESAFATFPDEEVTDRKGPGSGPKGMVNNGRPRLNVVIAIAGWASLGIAFATSLWPFAALGLVLLVAGIVIALFRQKPQVGLGTVMIDTKPDHPTEYEPG